MNSVFDPLRELLNGDAYCPHPGDAALALGRRFQSKNIVVVGGGATGAGWTQRVIFDRQGLPSFDRTRSPVFKRGTAEWRDHLLHEAQDTSGWAVLLIEQQWQAAVSSTSGASMGAAGVEQMLRVRDAVSSFGDDRMSEDALRCVIDHPTMEGSVVGGMRMQAVQALEREAIANGFKVAAVRIGVLCLLENHLARFHTERISPSRTIVAYDGQSAIIVGVRDGAFDLSEGALSYLVNRPAHEVRSQVVRRLSQPTRSVDRNSNVEIIGSTFTFDNGQLPESVDVRQENDDVVLAAVSEKVRHDLRTELQEMRLALPPWVRMAVAGIGVLMAACLVGGAIQISEALRLKRQMAAVQADNLTQMATAAAARARLVALAHEEARARRIGEWVDRNYHAQALLHRFFTALPTEVSLDAVSLQAAEGLPQAKLRFTLLGAEESQRAAVRAIEGALYELGYEVGKRDDPAQSTSRRGGVAYAWDLILPNFGA